jgi:hypothetical protein
MMVEHTKQILKDLGSGLVMRRSTADDAERLAEFNGKIHGDDPQDAAAVAAWTRDLLRNPPPSVSPEDFVVVEDTGSGEIVSTLDLISQTWTYEGIPFGVGRPELVGTDARYRNRGLVRAQFEVIHDWSQQRGELVQVITGIPYFYRQFQYEMGLDLGGGRSGFEPQVPKLKEGQEEPYRIRPVTETDLPWLMSMYQKECTRSMIASVRSEAHWRNELFEKSQENVNRFNARVIETSDGRPVGYLEHPWSVWGTKMVLTGYELAEGASFLAVTPSVIRYLWNTGQEYAKARGRVLDTFGFWLGSEHPAYTAAGKRLVSESKPYAYYVRVPDLPAFLRRIGPVLEQRLIDSVCEGHTGEMKISFYRDGVRLQFDQGVLVSVEPWTPKVKEDEGNAAFPNLTFLQLVFGYRTLAEIQHAYADCWLGDDTRVVLETIFPKKYSCVKAIS